MSRDGFFAKFLRFIGIVLMALTGGFTLLGGIGTTCAALFPTKYDSMAALAPFQWLYILFVLTGIVIGVMGIRATTMLIKGEENSYRDTLITLIAGAAIGVFHIIVSRALRGKSMPVDAVVYVTVLTLVIFMIFKIPVIWQGVDFSKSDTKSNKSAGGAAAILIGLMTLTIQYWMASTHTWDGINYANVFNTSLTLAGSGLILFGLGLFISWKNIWGTANRRQVQN